MQKGPYYHQQQQHQPQPPRGNQMVYSQQLNQLPNLSSQPHNTLMQAPMQAGPRPTFGTAGPTDTHSIRPIVGTRMPLNAYAQQGTPQEGGYGGHTPPQYHTYHVQTQNNMPFTSSYGNPNYLPRGGGSGYSPVYVVPQSVVPQTGGYANNVVIAPQPSQGHQPQAPQQQQPQQQHIYAQHGSVHTSQSSHMQQQQSQQQAQQQQQQQPQQHQQSDQYTKKRPTIKLTDPNTGKDLTSEILTKKNAKTNAKTAVNPDESIKAKTAALFAAQVAKKIAGSTPPPPNEKSSDPAPALEKTIDPVVPPSEVSIASTPAPLANMKVSAEPEKAPVDNQICESITEDPVSAPTSAEVPEVLAAKTTEEVIPKIVKSEAEAAVITDEKDGSTKEDKVNEGATSVDTSKSVVEETVKVSIENSIEAVNEQPPVESSGEVPDVQEEEDVTGIKVEPMYKVDGKVRPICKVEDEMLRNDAKLAAELVDKMNCLEVKESPMATSAEVKSEETSVSQVQVEDTSGKEDKTSVESSSEVQRLPESPPEKAAEKPIECVEVATSESNPEVVDDAVLLEKEVVNEESTKKENKNVKIEKNEEVNAPQKKEKPETSPAPHIQGSDTDKKATSEEGRKPTSIEKPVEIVPKKEVVKEEIEEDAKVKAKMEVKKEVPAEVNKEKTPSTASPAPVATPVEKKEPIVTKPKVDAISRFAPSFAFSPPQSVQTPPKPKAEEASRADLNGVHDVPAAQPTVNPVVKKKKGKGRFKDFDAKESDDLLSAFVDAPEAKVAPVPEPVKVEVPAEEMSWEDKDENSIAKEDIRGEDAEDDATVPKRVETKILKGPAATPTATAEERHKYDRDFLLKFQFEPICTSKPLGLPDIDIVLNEAHAPTKALIPGQSVGAPNMFMPTFMRQGSGGNRAGSGGDRDRDRDRDRDQRGDRGGGARNSRDNKGGRGSQGSGPRPQKVISIPHLQMEKLELKRGENEWKRPSQLEKNLSSEEKEMAELNRSVQSILNKLTPQKFKPLVQQMMDLKITNSAKLEAAIALIFSKAISEPGFSVAYANMCRVLTDKFNSVPVSDEAGAATVTFRKLLLNKCQAEFEKEKEDDKLLEEARAKTFEKEEERKLHLEELDYQELMNRRRTLGNIRFIGELYKLKMISEPIMHDCIYKLLKAEKQDCLEDQLECLCKLLATIGKGIDHPKAKPRMDQYFDQMKKIIEKKKISSRIKFALKDVIDLRGNDWVPRRDEGNPKTIDQIHKEAQEKEKKEEQARQQDKLNKKLEPRGRRNDAGGRDSPANRGGGGGGGGGGPPQSDGWNTVPNKSRPIQSAPVDANKFKLFKKQDLSFGGELSLGPGGRPGAWSKGASGGGSSRSGSGANTPTPEVDSSRNRFGALSDNSGAPGSLSPKPGAFGRHSSGGGSRKGSQEGNRNNSQNRNNPRSDGLRMVRDMTGPRYDSGSGSRNQSPASGSRNQSPAPMIGRNLSPAPARGSSSGSSRGSTPTVAEPVSEDKMRKVTHSTMEEYLGLRDMKEAALCIKELNSPARHPLFVEEAVTLVMEKKKENRHDVGRLIHHMIRSGILDVSSVCQGLVPVIEMAPDFAVDIPHIYKYLGEVLGPVVFDATLPLNKVSDNLQPLVSINKAGIVMAEALSIATQLASGKEESISVIWQASGIQWSQLLRSGEDVNEFLKDRKMEFTLNASSGASTGGASEPTPSAPTTNSTKTLQNEMLDILTRANETNKNDDLISFIEGRMDTAERKKAEFIRTLTFAVCSSAIVRNSSQLCECRTELLKKRKTILLKYIDRSKELELESLYALQQLAEELEHPRMLLRTIFNELYQGDVISEETFFEWEASKESPVGKGSALSSVKDFLAWLRKADEESNEDEEANATSPPPPSVLTPTNLA